MRKSLIALSSLLLLSLTVICQTKQTPLPKDTSVHQKLLGASDKIISLKDIQQYNTYLKTTVPYGKYLSLKPEEVLQGLLDYITTQPKN